MAFADAPHEEIGVSMKWGPLLGVPYNKDHGKLRSILRALCLWKPLNYKPPDPFANHFTLSGWLLKRSYT